MVNSTFRRTAVLGLAALLVAGGTVASANAVELSTDTQKIFTLGTGEDGETAIPELPAGMTYTKVSAGDGASVYLRSDGQVFGVGIDNYGSLDFPELPAGMTWVDMDSTGLTTALVRSDGQLFVMGGTLPGSAPTTVPALPAAVTYTRVVNGNGAIFAQRSDGRWTLFRNTADDRATNPDSTYFERVTEDTDYVDASGTYQSVLLLKASGRVKGIDFAGKTAATDVPSLPSGMQFVDVATNGQTSAFVRSDGKVVFSGSLSEGKLSAPALPKGVRYTEATIGNTWAVFLRSDGDAETTGYLDPYGFKPSVPTLPKGWRFTQLSGFQDNASLTAEKLTPNVTVQTSIVRVTKPSSVTKGSTAIIKVKVYSMATTRGGIVKVTYKNKIVGQAKVGDGAIATITVKTSSMKKSGSNKIGISFMGIGNAKKSLSNTRYVGNLVTK